MQKNSAHKNVKTQITAIDEQSKHLQSITLCFPPEILERIASFLPNEEEDTKIELYRLAGYPFEEISSTKAGSSERLEAVFRADAVEVLPSSFFSTHHLPYFLYYSTKVYDMLLNSTPPWRILRSIDKKDRSFMWPEVCIRGNLEIVQWLHESQTEGCSIEAMDGAAANGHLDMVKWLHENRTEGCTERAMDGAAANGHLEMVKWLYENRTEGCTIKAMDGAAKKGHLEMVKWLHENRTEGCSTVAMDSAAANGHLDMVKWLHENRTEGCTDWAMNYAADNGHLEIVQWLNKNRTERRTVRGHCLGRPSWLSYIKWVMKWAAAAVHFATGWVGICARGAS